MEHRILRVILTITLFFNFHKNIKKCNFLAVESVESVFLNFAEKYFIFTGMVCQNDARMSKN